MSIAKILDEYFIMIVPEVEKYVVDMLKLQSCKLFNNKYISSAQITNVAI